MTDVRPLIGVSTSELREARTVRPLDQGEPRQHEIALGLDYPEAVDASGGLPVILPPIEPEGVGDLVGRVSGLMLSGGPDLHPSAYGAPVDRNLGPTEPELDHFELALLREADALGMPILAICRGMQALNVARGGTLHQHLPDLVGHDGHSPVSGGYGSHPVKVAAGSRLAGVLGHPGPQDEIAVPTHHHQAVDRLGEGLTATAWTADGVIEAVEFAAADPDGPGRNGSGFALAVQWHPEAGQDQRLLRALVAAAGSLRRA